MSLKTLKTVLKKLDQEHLLAHIGSLSKEEVDHLLRQIISIDKKTLIIQERLVKKGEEPLGKLEVFENIKFPSSDLNEKGKIALQEGKVGCILVAGGQGTRLGFQGPKGCFPVTAIRHKTLFQYFTEKLKAASQFAKRPLSVALMTSPLNHEVTVNYFKNNSFFGVAPSQIDFFSQGLLPFLDKSGKLFFEDRGKIAFGPDGNGSCIKAFVKSGIAKKWQESGIEFVTFIMIDNPLAEPFDLSLIGSHIKESSDITVKCITRENFTEKVGLLLLHNGKLSVLEYSEMPKELWEAQESHGTPLYRFANISLFCFNLPFLLRAADIELPLHKAFKASDRLDRRGRRVASKKPCAWKFERFIFDILPLTPYIEAILYDRETCFAPLKNKEGNHDLKSVQKALISRDREIIQRMTGSIPPKECLEIDPAFYYPTDEILAEWSGKKLSPSPYIQS